MTKEISGYLLPKPKILEVGVGGSLTIHMLSNRGFNCFATDNKQMSLEYSCLLKQYFNSNVKLVKSDAFSQKFKENHKQIKTINEEYTKKRISFDEYLKKLLEILTTN